MGFLQDNIDKQTLLGALLDSGVDPLEWKKKAGLMKGVGRLLGSYVVDPIAEAIPAIDKGMTGQPLTIDEMSAISGVLADYAVGGGMTAGLMGKMPKSTFFSLPNNKNMGKKGLMTSQKGKGDISTVSNPVTPDGGLIHKAYQSLDFPDNWKRAFTKIRDYVDQNDGYHYGIRAIDPNIDQRLDIEIPQAGEVLPRSYVWDDGQFTDEALDGTAAFVPDYQEDFVDELPTLVREALSYWTPDDKIRYVLLRGDFVGSGGMPERYAGLIKDAEAVAIMDKTGNILDSIISPNPYSAPGEGARSFVNPYGGGQQ